MPAWPKLKLRLLADLAEQLRFAPKPAVLKDIARAAATIDLVEPEQDYPADWIVFRITGYRDEKLTAGTVPGRQLKAHLSSLIERLSAQASLREPDLADFAEGFSQPELLARWNVTRKTLERYRTRGLFALRIIGARGISRLHFPAQSVRRFESANRQSLLRAAAFSRMPAEKVRSLGERAKRLTRRTGAARSRISAHLARKSGRSVSAVDRIVRSVRKPARRLKPSAHARLLFRWEQGHHVGALARSLRKSRAAVIRAINLARAHRLEVWDPASRFPPEFSPISPSIHAIAQRCPRAAIVIVPPAEPTLQTLLDAMRLRERIDRDLERELIEAHHALIALAAAPPRGADDFDRAETCLRWAAKLRAAILRPSRVLLLDSIHSVVPIDLLSVEPALLSSALSTAGHVSKFRKQGQMGQNPWEIILFTSKEH